MGQTPTGLLGPSGPAALPVPAPRPSLWQRLQHGLMPVPRGLEGLLTDDDVKHARNMGLLNFGLSMLDQAHGDPMGGNAPSLGSAFAHSMKAGLGQYDQSLQSTAQQGVAGQELAQKRFILTNRMRVAQQFAPQPNETPEQTSQRLKGMYLEYLRAGDTEMAGKLGEVVSKLFAANDKPVEHVDLGDRTAILDPISGKTIRYEPNGIKPKTAAEVDASSKFQADQKNKILDDYARDTKDFHQVMAGWDVLVGATKNPNLATPFAVTDAYARITNPGAIVRPTTMEMIHDMGSIGQKMQKYWEQNVNGGLPPEILNDFKRTLYNIVREHKNQYDKIRKSALTRGLQSGISNLDPLLEDYNLENPLPAPPATAGTKTGANVKAVVGGIR